MRFVQCDVFSDGPFSGNSLAVFPDAAGLSGAQMQQLTRELRHFETTFLTGPAQSDGSRPLRVFDLETELPFAGHPLLGAAAVVHDEQHEAIAAEIVFALNERRVVVHSEFRQGCYDVSMDQGQPAYLATLGATAARDFAKCFSLDSADLADGLPAEVISTGLRYLVLPLQQGMERASICVPDLEQRLNAVGAEFAYLFDVNGIEGRHWNNDGVVEDVATGSAAGVVGAYAHKHELLDAEGRLGLRQGQYAGRPSRISVQVESGPAGVDAIHVGGQVTVLGRGQFEVLP